MKRCTIACLSRVDRGSRVKPRRPQGCVTQTNGRLGKAAKLSVQMRPVPQLERSGALHPLGHCSARCRQERCSGGWFWRATMMQRRLLGVGELASAGCSATCNLTKRLVIRINIFGRHIACALPPPAPCCHDGRLPFAGACSNRSRATLKSPSAHLSRPRITMSGRTSRQF